jgi:hypothetical protein
MEEEERKGGKKEKKWRVPWCVPSSSVSPLAAAS